MNIIKWYNEEFVLIFEYQYHKYPHQPTYQTSDKWFNQIELGKEYLVYVVLNDILWFQDNMLVRSESTFNDLIANCNKITIRKYYNDGNRFDIVRMSKLKIILS